MPEIMVGQDAACAASKRQLISKDEVLLSEGLSSRRTDTNIVVRYGSCDGTREREKKHTCFLLAS